MLAANMRVRTGPPLPWRILRSPIPSEKFPDELIEKVKVDVDACATVRDACKRHRVPERTYYLIAARKCWNS